VADRPNIVAGRNADNILNGTSTGCGSIAAGTPLKGPDLYFDPCAFSLQNLGLLGDAPRNFLQGPGQANMDLSLAKEFKLPLLGENGQIDFRFETFNIFNHPNFNIPVAGRTVFTANQTTPAEGVAAVRPAAQGSIERTRSDARKIQFGLKLSF
jgi:hypothetical protein